MKTLADEILEALPALVEMFPKGPTASELIGWLGASPVSVYAAMKELDADGRAILLRYPESKARYLLPIGHDLGKSSICANCGVTFSRPKKSKRRCCTRACSIAWSWTKPGVAERRRAGIGAERATPKAKARTAAFNRRRWAKPEEHAKLSEQNRREWADPAKKAVRAASIQAAHGTPEKRAFYADLRREEWADPAIRESRIAAMRASKSTPEARAKFSALLKARWQDPVLREKYLAAVRRTAEKLKESRRDG